MLKKRICYMYLIFVLLIMLEACIPQANNTPNKASKEIFCISSSLGADEAVTKKYNIPEEFGITNIFETEILENVATTKSSIVNGKPDLSYTHSNCAKKNSLSNEYGSFYSCYDAYQSDDERSEYLHGTDLLCFYFLSSDAFDETDTPIQEADAKSRSEIFLRDLLSDKIFSKFTFDHISFSPLMGEYDVLYIRYIYGYATDETLSVFINSAGQVSSYNGRNVKKYDHLIDKITKEKLDKTHRAILDEIDSLALKNTTVFDPSITTNNDGIVYLKVGFKCDRSDGGIDRYDMYMQMK